MPLPLLRTLLFLLLLMGISPIASAPLNGFVSLDCGSTSNWVDARTTIEWTADEPYVSSGTNGIISAEQHPNHGKQQWTMRYFSSNRRQHCYSLPAWEGASHLIRASFLHGAFQPWTDNSFGVAIDLTLVDVLTWDSDLVHTERVAEYVVEASSHHIEFCLLPLIGTSFINALELRPLAPRMYSHGLPSKYLKLLYRMSFGEPTAKSAIRYPDDEYDRMWPSLDSRFGVRSITTNGAVDVGDEYEMDRIPMRVLQSAWVGDGESFGLDLPVDLYEWESAETHEIYFQFVVANIRSGRDHKTSSIVCTLNGVPFHTLTLESPFAAVSGKSKRWVLNEPWINLTFSAESGSEVAPVLNAGEIYSLRDWVTSRTDPRDVKALEGVIYHLGLSSYSVDPCLPVPLDWLTCTVGDVVRVTRINLSGLNLRGIMSPSFAELTALTELHLDDNDIEGGIPDLSKLTSLRILHIQENFLSGPVPETLALLPALTDLNLSYNSFSGPLPKNLMTQRNLNLEITGNPHCCGPSEACAALEVRVRYGAHLGRLIASPVYGESNKWGITDIEFMQLTGDGLSIVMSLILSACIVGCWYLIMRWKDSQRLEVTRTGRSESRNPRADEQVSDETNSEPHASMDSELLVVQRSRPRIISQAELEAACPGFRDKIETDDEPDGLLVDEARLAINLLCLEKGQEVVQRFFDEIAMLSKLHHKNIVSLRGYCWDIRNSNNIHSAIALVYDFKANGTLHEYLHGDDVSKRLSWRQRLVVALGTARGMKYLHNEMKPRIIHGSVRSKSVLLDENLEAKLAGLDSAEPAADDQTGSRKLARTDELQGYLDPEYHQRKWLSHKSDIYSFGDLLLEITSGRRPAPKCRAQLWFKREKLVEWAREKVNQGAVTSIMDLEMEGPANHESLLIVAGLAKRCTEPTGAARPNANHLVRELIAAIDVEDGRMGTELTRGQQQLKSGPQS